MISLEFKKQYSRLNREQKLAVDTIEGPVMVIAGPGTGKTTILTLRIAQILRKTDTPPSGILAITYTDSGVKAMKQKLREIIGSRADSVYIHTFHSFAVSVIRDYPDHFPHLSNVEPSTDIEIRSFISEIIQSRKFGDLRPFGRPDLYVEPILKAISESKKEAWTPEMIKVRALEEIEKIKKDKKEYSNLGRTKGQLKAQAQKRIQKNERTIIFSDVYKKYEEIKKKKRKIDFDDMIFELEMALRKDELLLRLLQEQYLYLLVDEHQDTNDSQNMLVLMIADFFDTPNVFIVGDEKQAIYRFQGASIENFLKFKREWKNVKLIQLDKSYRSHQKILDAAYHLIEHNYDDKEFEDLRIALRSDGKKKGKPVIVVKGENIRDTESYLILRLQEILAKEPKADVAIIVRTNASVGRLKRLCESYGVRSVSVRNIGIFSHSAGRLFFDLLGAVFNPLDVESLGKTIVSGLWGLSFNEQVQILKEIRSGRDISKWSLLNKLISLRDSLLSGDPMGFLFEAVRESGYIDKISLEPERVEVWRGILEFAETILRSRNNSEDAVSLVEELLSYREMSEQRQVKVASGDIDAKVKIMTAHGSKGSEFDYCFLPYATESFWMKKSKASFFSLPFEETSPEEDIKDSRRLFYVALTRAKKHLEILTHSEMEGGEKDIALRFIGELGVKNVSTVNLTNTKKKITPKSEIKVKIEKLKRGLLEAAKRTVLEKGLSVTALNHFLECPNMFLYKSVLKIPDSPSAAGEKGTAMHLALAHLFNSSVRGLKKIEETLTRRAFEHLDSTYLRKFEISALKETLKKEIPSIALWVKSYFNFIGEINVERSITGEVLAVFSNGTKLKIPLHGRLDLMIIQKNTVEVFDYKTRKKMSEAAIRG